jgi:regulator of sirC expression with transglutaminase-like and TPR domain
MRDRHARLTVRRDLDDVFAIYQDLALRPSNVDDLATVLAQMPDGHKASMQNAEIVGVKQPPVVLD